MKRSRLFEGIRNELLDGSNALCMIEFAAAHPAPLRADIEERRLHERMESSVSFHRHVTRPLDVRIVSYFRMDRAIVAQICTKFKQNDATAHHVSGLPRMRPLITHAPAAPVARTSVKRVRVMPPMA